ncbi:glycerate kinase [Alpinimonas psychrophila]|uniref:Glycerate kinase n=1 Tax=Alpinimonas psychrophila TaxID=748908 RepID=A0A7W3PP52_9MICO|nr:glycerate kinase [Alpinimonas psychrophila]MBA8829549.1 glycerate kinase [Alpinimonas psychrophila]
MRIVIAPDSFKGSLSAAEAAAAMAAGVRDVFGDTANIVQRPMADGGEGTLDVIASAWEVVPETMTTVDAIGRPIRARFGISTDGRRAIIEAAEANGLPHVSDVTLRPLRADTFGVGLIARKVLDRGATEILLCIGGSATTDGGTGLLTALGVRFLDAHGRNVAPGGEGLAAITSVDLSHLHARARLATWRIAVDVDNPLCGEQGAAATFGPQKGASPHDVGLLDAGLAHLAGILHDVVNAPVNAVADIQSLTGPGFGAAGGLPVCMVALLDAHMVQGSRLVVDAIGLAEAMAGATLVFTGEGSFDSQSLGGKVIDGVIAAASQDCPIIVIAGRVALSAAETRAAGVAGAFSIAPGPTDLARLVTTAAERVRETTAHVCGLLAARA